MPEERASKQRWIGLAILVLLIVGGLAVGTLMKDPGTSPAGSEAGPPTDRDWLIRPGQSMGPITAETSLNDLQRVYGAENVVSERVHIGEGQSMPGTVIFPDDPARRAAILWKDTRNHRQPESIRLHGNQSRWHTGDGITLGTSLQQLEAFNGGPFKLTGFGWDYSGTVLSWGDTGRLQERYQKTGSIVLRLAPPDGTDEQLYRPYSGDAIFSSDEPGMRQLNPRVYTIIVTFN